MSQYIILADLDRCIGCKGGCQVACKTEHGIALGPSRSKNYTVGPFGEFPDLSMYFVPVMCQQCENPACVKVCPAGACAKSSRDGVVYIDRKICVGCQSCIRACPYKANFLNSELRVSDKCDICRNRRDAGKVPACVRNCAGNCLYFGDTEDPESDVSRIMREAGPENVYSLREEAGCKPSGRFILRKAKWVDPPW